MSQIVELVQLCLIGEYVTYSGASPTVAGLIGEYVSLADPGMLQGGHMVSMVLLAHMAVWGLCPHCGQEDEVH